MGDVSKVQLMVALLRSLGLRTRLVMVLHPLPLKAPSTGQSTKKGPGPGPGPGERKSSGKKGTGRRRCGKVTEGLGMVESLSGDTGGERGSDGVSLSRGFGERLLSFNLQRGSIGDSADSLGGTDWPKVGARGGDGGASGSVNEKTTSCGGSGAERMERRARGKARKAPVRRGSRAVTSHYFRKQESSGRDQEGEGHGSTVSEEGQKSMTLSKIRKLADHKESTSPEFGIEENEEDDDDDDFIVTMKRKRKRKLVSTPIKKLKKAMISRSRGKASSTIDVKSPPAPSPSLLKSPGASTPTPSAPEVELVGVEETGRWAEVYFPSRKRWVCVHLPSLSVDQPQLCEKHCWIPLHYVVAFENSEC